MRKGVGIIVLNKNNYGYLSPADFNLYAQQAQLDLFEDIFYQFNNQVNKENLRGSKIYVSLEPCTHYGKTPPCSKLIIKSTLDG